MKLYNKNTYIHSSGLDVEGTDKIIQNILDNNIEISVNRNPSYQEKPLDREKSIKKLCKYLDREKISYTINFKLKDSIYDLKINYSRFLIHLCYERNIESDYNINLSKLASKNGYFCYHIFPWDNLEKFVMCLNYKWKIDIKDTIINQVGYIEVQKFFDKYSTASTNIKYNTNYGIFRENGLISCASFKLIDEKENKWMLINLINKFHYVIENGNKTLLQSFIDFYKPSSIIAFSDNSKSNGDLLRTLRFKKILSNDPNLIYCRYKTGISNEYIKSILDIDNNTTIQQMMYGSNYYSLYDCGYDVYELRL